MATTSIREFVPARDYKRHVTRDSPNFQGDKPAVYWHACIDAACMHARGEARANRVSVIFNSFLVKRYGSLRGHFTLGRIQRDAQRTDVTEIDPTRLSLRWENRMHPPSFPESENTKWIRSRCCKRRTKRKDCIWIEVQPPRVVCLARLLHSSNESSVYEREREKERCGDSGANSRPFERMTINEATV